MSFTLVHRGCSEYFKRVEPFTDSRHEVYTNRQGAAVNACRL